MSHHNELGKKGELMAIKYLKDRGYKILEVNWRDKHKEIDIIARDKNQIVFIEVKTRRNDYFGAPEEAVDMRKQKFLVDAAEEYINNKNIDLDARFDIISILMDRENPNIKHIKEAFYSSIN